MTRFEVGLVEVVKIVDNLGEENVDPEAVEGVEEKVDVLRAGEDGVWV